MQTFWDKISACVILHYSPYEQYAWNVKTYFLKKIRKMSSLSCLLDLPDESWRLTLLLLCTTCPVLANSVDPDQLASEEANSSGSALFVIKICEFLSKTQIKYFDWLKIGSGHGILIYSAWQGLRLNWVLAVCIRPEAPISPGFVQIYHTNKYHN